MNRIEVNVSTGERKVIPLTEEEIADAHKRTEEEQIKRVSMPPPPPSLAEIFFALKKKGILSDDDFVKP